MNRACLISALIILGCTKIEEVKKFKYPETRKDTTIVDNYFGTTVPDPYRWLENENSDETANWIKRQNKLTFSYLDQLPHRDKIRQRLETLCDYERYGLPKIKAGKCFYFKNDGIQDQSVLYVQDSLNAEPKVVIDPNILSEDGTLALGDFSVSKNGKYLAYQLAKSGSDWNQIRIKDLDTDKDLDEVIDWVKFSGISWKGNGFYYSCYDEPKDGSEYSEKNEFHKVYYHHLGTSQSNDELIYWNENEPLRNYNAWIPDAEDAVVIFESQSTSGSQLYYKAEGDIGFTQITESFEYDYKPLHHNDGRLLVCTNNGASNYRVLSIDTRNKSSENWLEIIPEKEQVIEDVQLAGDRLIVSYMQDVCSVANIHDLDGNYLRSIDFPTKGTASFSGSNDSDVAFFSFTSFTYPTTVFEYNIASGKRQVFQEPIVDFDADKYDVEQVFYESKDGTRIPMFIVHKKGIKLDGSNPCLLYGYGGFNISVKPRFSATRLVFLENGGIFVQANIRGGGEYGHQWHSAGTKHNKQNVFDDFIAGAEYLISEGYTNPGKLGVSGRSNGGLLVGACMTQRPDLFKVALPSVGVLDMLRFHKFTIGWAWTGDYGSSDNKDEFEALYSYSPLHNIKEDSYPATLVTTADHDDRVVPAHSFKFISELQDKHVGNPPVMIRIDVDAGHGAGKPLTKILDEEADVWAFVFEHLEVKTE